MSILEEIAAERRRQVARGYDATHDDAHVTGDIAMAGAAYALHAAALPGAIQGEVLARWRRGQAMTAYPWPGFAPNKQDRALLITALALLVAEVERLDRAERRPIPDHGEALRPDRFWIFGHPRDSVDEITDLMLDEDMEALKPVPIGRAITLAPAWAVHFPYSNENIVQSYATRDLAEAAINAFRDQAQRQAADNPDDEAGDGAGGVA